ncbi:MAG: OsmC family protein [Opitutaceae bacterium]|nr:OsmC family protein [Opitutaceae bacterium]
MVKITGEYQGELHCRLTHGPSGKSIETDAPVDNNGKGEAFSPTDLCAASLASCMVTVMNIAARNRLKLDLKGIRFEVTKEMSADAPRRIARLRTEIWLPVPRSVDPQGILEAAALSCPVHQSLHPSIEQPVVFHWKE